MDFIPANQKHLLTSVEGLLDELRRAIAEREQFRLLVTSVVDYAIHMLDERGLNAQGGRHRARPLHQQGPRRALARLRIDPDLAAMGLDVLVHPAPGRPESEVVPLAREPKRP